MLNIDNHRLVGDGVTFRATPNHGGPLSARYLVFHYTAGSSCDSSVESLCTQKARGSASAHLVLARDGRIVQLAPFNVVTWHAGVSCWEGRTGLNRWSIGIEMDNAGRLQRIGEKFVAWFGKEFPAADVLLSKHKHGGGVLPWHIYSEVQLARAAELAQLLVNHYGLHDVLGHEDIAPGRKQDPGPAFPLAPIARRALRSQASLTPYVVTSDTLNIRSGPGVSFDLIAPALLRDAVVLLLERAAGWSKVRVERPDGVAGWVNRRFIAPFNKQQSRRTRANPPRYVSG